MTCLLEINCPVRSQCINVVREIPANFAAPACVSPFSVRR